VSRSTLVEAADLSVVFGQGRHRVAAAKSVSFVVPAGGSFGLVGESGSGKSTVLRVIAGLIDDWSGRVALDGRPVARRRSLAERKLVQMVFQDPYGSLHPHHTVDRTLAEPARVRSTGSTGSRSGSAGCCRRSAWGRSIASAIPISSPAASASGWPSPAP